MVHFRIVSIYCWRFNGELMIGEVFINVLLMPFFSFNRQMDGY